MTGWQGQAAVNAGAVHHPAHAVGGRGEPHGRQGRGEHVRLHRRRRARAAAHARPGVHHGRAALPRRLHGHDDRRPGRRGLPQAAHLRRHGQPAAGARPQGRGRGRDGGPTSRTAGTCTTRCRTSPTPGRPRRTSRRSTPTDTVRRRGWWRGRRWRGRPRLRQGPAPAWAPRRAATARPRPPGFVDPSFGSNGPGGFGNGPGGPTGFGGGPGSLNGGADSLPQRVRLRRGLPRRRRCRGWCRRRGGRMGAGGLAGRGPGGVAGGPAAACSAAPVARAVARVASVACRWARRQRRRGRRAHQQVRRGPGPVRRPAARLSSGVRRVTRSEEAAVVRVRGRSGRHRGHRERAGLGRGVRRDRRRGGWRAARGWAPGGSTRSRAP